MPDITSNLTFWATIGTWLGPVVTIVGFILVIRQLSADRQTLETQTSWQIYNVGAAVLQTFVNHPECRPYFYENKPLPPDEPLRSTILAVNELICDHMENIVLHVNALDDETYRVWKIYMQGLYNRCPTMQEFLRKENEGYRYSHELLVILSEGAKIGVGSNAWITRYDPLSSQPHDNTSA
ncbi:hypothetical protein [Castellaniella sp.]|uniref:hypothetical protein n=1 Tax=Castellaniella sp. TaxID=1955812 RepID=UPI003C75F009